MFSAGLVLTVFGCAERVANDATVPPADPSAEWARAVEKIARPDGIDVDALRASVTSLNRYLAWAGEHGQHTDNWRESKEDKRIAFLVNVHNAAVLHNLLRHDLPESPDTVAVGWYRWPGAGFYWGSKYRVDGEWSAIRHVGFHDTVSRYQEPLLWVALHDGTKDSAPLRWWRSKNLQKRLQSAMRAHINSERGMQKVDESWTVNPLFLARADDFVFWTDAEDVCDWMAGYATDERKEWLTERIGSCDLTAAIPDRRTDAWTANSGAASP